MKLPEPYDFEFSENAQRPDCLALLLSPSRKASNRTLDFGCDTFRIWDNDDVYYLLRVKDVAEAFAEYAKTRKKNKIFLMGASKAGFGSLLWGGHLARLLPEVRIHILAFSPQVVLYPRDEQLSYASYKLLWRKAEKRKGVERVLEMLGNPIPALKRRNISGRAFYPSLCEEDARQASFLDGTRVKPIGMPISVHNVLAAFTIDMSVEENARRHVQKMLLAAKTDEDLATFVSADKEAKLIAEYHSLGRLPSPVEEAEAFFARRNIEPSTTDAVAAT